MQNEQNYYVEQPKYEPIQVLESVTPKALKNIFLVFGVMLTLALGAVIFMAILLIGGQARLTDTLLTNRQNGFKSRAVVCESEYAQGLRFQSGHSCLSNDVRLYWNPHDLQVYRAKP